MSVENSKVCCNCRHCIRERDEETLYTHCYCEVDNCYLGYMTVMTWWCRHWARERKWDNEMPDANKNVRRKTVDIKDNK